MKAHLQRREPRTTPVRRLATTLRSVRSPLLFAIAILLIGTSPAFAQTASLFGNDASSGTPSNPLSANFKRASRVTLNEHGTLIALSAYLQGTDPGGTQSPPTTQLVEFAIYSDAGGVPGTLLAQSNGTTLANTSTAQWVTEDLRNQVILAAGSYWIAILTGTAAGAVVDFSNDTTPNWYGNAEDVQEEPAVQEQFGSGSRGTGTLLVKGYYLPDSILSQFGRTDVASAPSSGLSANFKRGSQFTVSEQVTLDTLNAYLDGNGGASGFQQVGMALYRDAGGVPGALVAQSGAQNIVAGTGPRWYTFRTSNAPLDPGVYWIVLLSGGGAGNAGVVRDYGDGPANWYGNSNPSFTPGEFTVGASDPFGSGTASGGTLSVYASYRDGVTTAQFGETGVGSTPSAGLTANFIRGSTTTFPTNLRTYATPTGFYAYLDGNGGASGAQQLRVAVYNIDPHTGNPSEKVAESSVVTIEAGMPAQWVFFPVAPFPLIFGQSWLTIESGNVGGVARDYGTPNAGFWAGASTPFGTQAPTTFPTPMSNSSTDLSIYAVYVAELSPALPP